MRKHQSSREYVEIRLVVVGVLRRILLQRLKVIVNETHKDQTFYINYSSLNESNNAHQYQALNE